MKNAIPGQQEMAMPTSSYQLPSRAAPYVLMQQNGAHLESASFQRPFGGAQAHVEQASFQRPVVQVPVEPASFQLPQVAEAPYQKPPWPAVMNFPPAQARTPPFPQTMSPRQEPLHQLQQQRFNPQGGGGPPAMNYPQEQARTPRFPQTVSPWQEPLQQLQQQCFNPQGGLASARGVSTPPNFLRNGPPPRTSSFLVPKGSLGPHRTERDGGNLFRALDLNHDGVVSDDEIERFIDMRDQRQQKQKQKQQQYLEYMQQMGQGQQPWSGPAGKVMGSTPMATAVIDANRDGVFGDAGDIYATGIDLNRDGIPDVLQAPPRGVQYAQRGMGPHVGNFYGPAGAYHNGCTSPGGWGLRRELSLSEASNASDDCCTRN